MSVDVEEQLRNKAKTGHDIQSGIEGAYPKGWREKRAEQWVKLDDAKEIFGAWQTELQKLTEEFPSLTELHASFPNENLLVWRAKVIEWFKRLEKVLANKGSE